MPKCLHPPCDRLVDDALYCDEHKYIPHWTTNITRVEDHIISVETDEWIQASTRSLPSEPYGPSHRAPILRLALLVLILALVAVGVIVALKLIF
jgi:hypothetical protein